MSLFLEVQEINGWASEQAMTIVENLSLISATTPLFPLLTKEGAGGGCHIDDENIHRFKKSIPPLLHHHPHLN